MSLRKKITKGSAVAMTVIVLGSNITIPIHAVEKNRDTNINVINISNNGNIYSGKYEVENNEVEYILNKDTFTIEQKIFDKNTQENHNIKYDIDDGILIIDDIKFTIETSFDYIDKDVYKNEEEALRIHNEQLVNSFLNSVSLDKNKSSVGQYVPSNAPYTTIALVNKKLNLFTTETIEKKAASISNFTNVLTFLPGIPKQELLFAISEITRMASDIIAQQRYTLDIIWKYGQDRTNKKYNLGPSGTDYAYRFRHQDITFNISLYDGKFARGTKPFTKIGGWWTDKKPM